MLTHDYAFGLEEHVYSSSGTPQSSTYYYMLGGRLLGELQGSTTQFFLTDALGSVLTTFNATAGSAAVQGNQVYGPYGTSRYSQGAMGTNKGFTGQYADATGLDYYNARYYDPVVGLFLAADVKQGDLQGMNPYGYVGGNPEALTDPTGEFFAQGDDNGMVQNIGRLSNTTTADGGSGISVVTENVNTGKTTRTVVPIKKPIQPVVSGGSKCGGCKMVSNSSAKQSTTQVKSQVTKPPDFGAAQQAALVAFEKFGEAALAFTVLAVLFHNIAAALVAGSIPEWLSEALAVVGLAVDALAAHVEALAWAAGVLAAESAFISGAFGVEASLLEGDWAKDRSHITDFFGFINGTIQTIGGAALTLATGLFFLTKSVPAWIVKTLSGGSWIGASGVAVANGRLFLPWSQQAEHDQLNAIFGG